MRTLDSVAVISDLHGVAPVLEAVLAEPDVAAADLVVATGDLASGPMPVETLDALLALGDRCVRSGETGTRPCSRPTAGRRAPMPRTTGPRPSSPSATPTCSLPCRTR